MRWFWLVLTVVAVILVPFFLFEEYFTALATQASSGGVSTSTAIVIIGTLLALDVFLPVPSSIVSAAAGVLFGFWAGTAVVFVGMTISCAIAYVVGARATRLATRLVGDESIAKASRIAARYGLAAIAFSRPVPVLAEASVVFAGMVRVPPARFLLVCVLSNFGVAVVYAGIGAYSMNANSFLFAFLAAMSFPAAAWLVARLWSGPRASGSQH